IASGSGEPCSGKRTGRCMRAAAVNVGGSVLMIHGRAAITGASSSIPSWLAERCSQLREETLPLDESTAVLEPSNEDLCPVACVRIGERGKPHLGRVVSLRQCRDVRRLFWDREIDVASLERAGGVFSAFL